MLSKKLVLILAALFVAATLAACSSAGQSSGGAGAQQEGDPRGQAQNQQPKKMTKRAENQQVAPTAGGGGGGGGDQGQAGNQLEPAQDKTLRLTVPKLAEIKNDEIPTGSGSDENLLRDYAAVRLRYTGFPWQEEANIYIAGHRIGFPGTNSNLAFYDLEDLRNGDEVFLEDAEGRRYTYEVYEKEIVEPTDLSVLKPVKGKNIVTLQTCTLPDYTDRVVYRAELKDIQA